MKLYLLRHGKAEDDSATGRDQDRELTAEGVEEVRAEAKALARLNLKLDVIITTPYPRASRTAEIVAEELEMGGKLLRDDRLACGFRVSGLPGHIRGTEGRGAANARGAQPGPGRDRRTVGRRRDDQFEERRADPPGRASRRARRRYPGMGSRAGRPVTVMFRRDVLGRSEVHGEAAPSGPHRGEAWPRDAAPRGLG